MDLNVPPAAPLYLEARSVHSATLPCKLGRQEGASESCVVSSPAPSSQHPVGSHVCGSHRMTPRAA